MNGSDVCLGVGAYDNDEWRLVKIGRWIEYACGVKSETINLDSIVALRCAGTSFLSEEMLGCILRVGLEYASRVSGYDPSTRYRLDSYSIPGWLEIFGAGSVSGESRSWQQFSCAIDWKSVNMVDSLNIPNSFGTVGSIRCTSNWHASNNLNQTWTFSRTSKHGSCSQVSLSQFHMDNMQWKCAALTDSHKRIYLTVEFDLVHHQMGAPAVHHILVYSIQAMIQFTRCLFSIDFISYSSQLSTNTKWNCTLTHTPGLLNCAIFSIPFAYVASVGEIVFVEWLKRCTLISLPWSWSFIHTIWRHEVSLLRQPLRMDLMTLQNPVYHHRRDVWSVHQTM